MTLTVTEIRVFWDSSDSDNEGWSFLARFDNDTDCKKTGKIEGVDADDIDNAIAEACRILDVELTPDQFACDSKLEGGFAIWTATTEDGNQ